MKHGDRTRLGQLAILQPMIVAREMKTYKQKPAPIWATWPGQEEGEGRRVWSPQRRGSGVVVFTSAMGLSYSHQNWSLIRKPSEKSTILVLRKTLVLGFIDFASFRDSGGRNTDKL